MRQVEIEIARVSDAMQVDSSLEQTDRLTIARDNYTLLKSVTGWAIEAVNTSELKLVWKGVAVFAYSHGAREWLVNVCGQAPDFISAVLQQLPNLFTVRSLKDFIGVCRLMPNYMQQHRQLLQANEHMIDC